MPSDLIEQARDFAARISALLNGTVTNGPRVSAVVAPRGAVVGYKVTRDDPFRLACVPLTLAGTPRCHLLVSHQLELDPEGIWLTVRKTAYGLYLDGEPPGRPVVRYDFDREPTNEYPAAHAHVDGDSENLAELCRRVGFERQLQRVHLPLGGKRFRPTLEDLVEFAIVERFAEPRDGWRDVIDEHRREFYVRQLRAGVRRDAHHAAEELRAMGWTLTPPAD